MASRRSGCWPARASVRSSTKRIALLLACLASSGLGGWLALGGLNPGRLLGEATKARPAWLAAAISVFAIAIALRALRWWLLFPSRRPPVRGVTLATLVGYLFNNLLPARAGEAARLVSIRRTGGVSTGCIAGTIISERIIDTAVLLLLFLAISPLARGEIFSGTAEAVAVVSVALLVAFLVWVARYKGRPSESHFPGGRLPARLAPHVDGLLEGLATFRRDRSSAAAALSLTALSWLLLGASNWLLAIGMGLPISFAAALLVALATGLAMIIPSAPASLGVFEATAVLALHGYPLTHLQAASYAIAVHAMNVIPLVLAGAIATAVVFRPKQAPSPRGENTASAEVSVVRVALGHPDGEAAQGFNRVRR